MTLLPEKSYTIPKSTGVVQMQSNRKNVYNSTSDETVIISKVVILKPCILNDLDRQPRKSGTYKRNR